MNWKKIQDLFVITTHVVEEIMAENVAENTAGSPAEGHEIQESREQLTPWSTVFVEELEVLSEEDLTRRFDLEKEKVDRLADEGSVDINEPVANFLKIISNFSTL